MGEATTSAVHDAAGGARQLRLLVADDHEMLRMALRVALHGLASDMTWYDAASAADVEALLAVHPDIDLALLDLHMPGVDGVPWVGRLRATAPDMPLVIVSGEEDPAVVTALLRLGVAGYVPKSDPPRVIRQAIELVLAGGRYVSPRLLTATTVPVEQPAGSPSASALLHKLTDRQREVMHLLARGQPNKLIARELGISEATVKVHLLAIYRALGVRNRTEAVVVAQRLSAGNA